MSRLPVVLAFVSMLILNLQTSLAQFSFSGCKDFQPGDFRKVVLVNNSIDKTLIEPTKLAFLPDGRFFYIERTGKVKLYNPTDKSISVVWDKTVYAWPSLLGNKIEDGMIGIGVDPAFATNAWVYLYYSPKPDTAQFNRLSRFTFTGGKIDPSTEKIMLEIPVQRYHCCHTGGEIAFDAQGNLFMTTGDNTWSEAQYAAIDDKSAVDQGKPGDARRSSSNTNDLRGKLIRIKPNDVAPKYYSIPAGNLFPPGTDSTRPEIYSMGHRNPYSMSVDKATGWVVIGEVGPDAGQRQAQKGPASHEELNLVTKPGNFGWPFVIGNNVPYANLEFGAQKNGTDAVYKGMFDPANLVNLSPWNTGKKVLPPAIPAMLSYEKGIQRGKTVDGVERWKETTGSAAITGPIYRYDGALNSLIKFPPHFQGKWFFTDYTGGGGWLNAASLASDGSKIDSVLRLKVTLDDGSTTDRPYLGATDLEFGPDGALYAIEYGPGNFVNNGAAMKISRLEYRGDCRPTTSLPGHPNRQGLKSVRHPTSLKVHMPTWGGVDIRGIRLAD